MANTTIPSELIADGSVVTAKIADDAVDADKLASNAVVTASIADDAVTLAKMAANSVDSDQYVDGSIDTIHIADGAITSAKLDTNIAVGGTLTVTGDANFDSNTLFVDASANSVGIGTSSPSAKLHVDYDVEGFGNNIDLKNTNNSSIYSRGSAIGFEVSNGSETKYAAFIKGGRENTTSGGYLYFENADSSWNTPAEHIRITSAGKFVVGDTTALNGAGALGSFVFSGGQGVFISTVSQSTGEVMGFVHQKTSVVGTIAIDSSSTTYNTSSDGRLKEITGDAKGLEIINKLNPVAFNWKVDNKSDEGLIAQEVLDIVPNAVSQRENGYYQMDYSKLVTPLIKAIQEQQALIESLTARITTLEG